ncbi:MAG TPA: hypothetical protein GXX18_10070 [Bacillales bacterium]|nr:hypothetical protein [Bacillales bacterium]
MFDPTIFDNLKVVAEGAVYDLDLEGEILITNRMDQIDLAKLSRYYAVTFRKKDEGDNSVHGEFRIYADVHDLSAEIMEIAEQSIGCQIEVVFFTTVKDPKKDCEAIQSALLEIWGDRPSITQEISYHYDTHTPVKMKNTIFLKFDRKIGEAQVDDLPIMVDYMVGSIDHLNELKFARR